MESVIEFLFGKPGIQQGWIVPVAMGLASLAASWFGARKQSKENRGLAEFQNDANKSYLKDQLEYNTPKNQMSRFQDAGLNPNLIYGQGNPGSQSAPLSYPETRPADYQSVGKDMLPMMNQTALIQSQVQAQQAKTRQIGIMGELNKMQMAVLAKNPLLDAVGFSAIIDSLKATAESKAAGAAMDKETADWFTGEKSFKVGDRELHGPAGIVKMEAEMNLLLQKFQLNTADAKIKAEVLNSKAFQNEILEIQKKFIKDGDIGPQQILQFIQLLLMKML